MKKELKKEYGITLVALVITIILLLILAGISIQTLAQTNLFNQAKQAKNATENAQKEENKILSEYIDKTNEYLPETLAYKVNSGEVAIGSYIKYEPDEVSEETINNLITELGTYSGSNENTKSTLAQEKLNWRVLDVKDGQVRLISEVPTTSPITLFGYNGYNNAVKLLDDTCSTLYNNSKLASKVQNLKIEDIQDKMKEKDNTKINSNYGQRFTPDNKYYPSLLLKEKEQKVTVGENTTTGLELDLSEQNSFINQVEKMQANTLDLKSTFWNKLMESEEFDSSKYYELFINNGENYNTYWMSSRCIDADSKRANFCVHLENFGYVRAYALYSSYGDEFSYAYAFRPVITLNSNVQIDTANSGNGSTANDEYAIK